MYTFIVNPNARSGRGLKTWQELKGCLRARKVDFITYLTEYPRHAVDIARELTGDDMPHKIIVLGGDGTVGEVIEGIFDLSKTTLGYIPIGSSNDFARGLGLSADPFTALTHILAPEEYIYINVGVLSHIGGPSDKKRFAVSAGIGFDAGVCQQVAVSRLKRMLNRIGLGKLTYTGIAVRQLLFSQPDRMILTLDQSKRLAFSSVIFAAVMNTRFEGGGFEFCPEADPGDDMLDVIVIDSIPKLKALLLLPTAFKGWHVHFRGIHTYTCKSIDIHSIKALPVHTDGEPLSDKRHIAASLEPEKLRVILS